jgi:hypothetical protein
MWLQCEANRTAPYDGAAKNAHTLISNFRRVLNVVCFLLGNSPTSEFYMQTFRNTLSVSSSWADRYEGYLSA